MSKHQNPRYNLWYSKYVAVVLLYFESKLHFHASRCRVVVVGAGVIGLSVAVHICERFGGGVEVTLVAEKFSPHTTGDKAGMLMYPTDWNDSDSLVSGKSAPSKAQEQSLRWAEQTFRKYAGTVHAVNYLMTLS